MSVNPKRMSVNPTHTPKPVAERYGFLKPIIHVPLKGWLCKCDCGGERYVDGNQLRNWRVTSCGCGLRSKTGHSPIKINSHLIPKNYPLTGTRCWCCRMRTGVDDPVALCKVCRGEKK